MDADGSNVVRLTTDPADEFMPVWSPDGTTIAFVRNTEKASVSRPAIFTMRPDGSDVRQVSSGDGGSDWWPSWSPDGSRLAFAAIRNEDWGIWTVNADGSDEQMIFGGTGAGYVDNPVWSPEGSLIAFVGNLEVDDYSPQDALYVMNADGTGLTPIADEPGVGVAGDIAWQPLPAPVETVGPTPVPTGAEVVETFDVANDVRSVAYGEGSIWVAASNDDGSFGGRIIRIDPATHEVQAEIPVEVIPTWEVGGGAMVVSDGSLWVTGSLEAPGAFDDPGGGADAAVIRIDTTTDEVVQTFELGGTHGADLTFLDGELWVLVFGDESVDQEIEVVRLDLSMATSGADTARDGMGALDRRRRGSPGRPRERPRSRQRRRLRGGDRSEHRRRLEVEVLGEYITPMPVIIGGQGGSRSIPGSRVSMLGEWSSMTRSRFRGGSDCCGFVEADDRGIWFLSLDPQTGTDRQLNLFDAASGDVAELAVLEDGALVAMAVAPDSIWILNYEGTPHARGPRAERTLATMDPWAVPSGASASARSTARNARSSWAS